MSVVVAVKENGVIYMGADSQVTAGNYKTHKCNPNNIKIWNVRGVPNCKMGHVGSHRECNVIRLMDNLVSDYDLYKKNVDFEFVVKSIVPDILHELRKYGYLSDETPFKDIDSHLIFAFEDQAYEIDSDGCVIEIDDFIAIGSGDKLAMCSLNATVGENPYVRIIKAIHASTDNCIYVDYPIILTSTDNDDYLVVTKNNEEEIIKQVLEDDSTKESRD